MPNYSYKKCPRCGAPDQDRNVPMCARDLQDCYRCGHRLEKQITAPALHGFDSNGSSGHR